jgi:hypothetical protein
MAGSAVPEVVLKKSAAVRYLYCPEKPSLREKNHHSH